MVAKGHYKAICGDEAVLKCVVMGSRVYEGLIRLVLGPQTSTAPL